MTIEVLKPGLMTTLQDRGRVGCLHLGVGRSGAFDAPALRLANALAGNPADACGLEITLLGPGLRFERRATIAVTGASVPFAVDGHPAPMWSPVAVSAGAVVTLGAIGRGCRACLAVRGGLQATPVLGSRSTDVNAALGPWPCPLQRGDRLQTVDSGAAADPVPRSATGWQLDPRPWQDDGADLRLVPAPDLERLEGISHKSLFVESFTVQRDSNRVGVRLGGPELAWHVRMEMVSEGCVPGLVQLPPSGQPIVFGPECPVSGGYPRLGQLAAVDLPRLAQRRPGDAVRFRPCSPEQARAALDRREQALVRLEAAIAARLAAGG